MDKQGWYIMTFEGRERNKEVHLETLGQIVGTKKESKGPEKKIDEEK